LLTFTQTLCKIRAQMTTGPYSFYRAWIAAGLMGLVAACSNPLSSKHVAGLQNFRSPDLSCSNLDLSSPDLTPKVLRSLLHCLNSKNEIEAYESLSDSVSDENLLGLTEEVNGLAKVESKSLFAFRELYRNGKTNGDLLKLETGIQTLLARPEENHAMSETLNRMAPEISSWLGDSSQGFNFASLELLLKAKAFSRLKLEVLANPALKKLLISTSQLLNRDTTYSLPDLLEILNQALGAKAWGKLSPPLVEKKIRSLSHFMEWVLNDQRFDILSRGLSHFIHEPVTCFDGHKKLDHSFQAAIAELKTMSPMAAGQFFRKDLKNLVLASQGYCTLPYSTDALLELLGSASNVDGFAEAYSLLLPILSDVKFASYLGSESIRNLVHENQELLNQHLLQDLMVMAKINESTPLFQSSNHTLHALDQFFRGLSPETAVSLTSLVNRLATSSDDLNSLVSIAHTWIESLPSLVPKSHEGSIKGLQSILESPFLESSLNLTRELITQKKAEPLIDQAFTYFSKIFDSGEYSFRLAILPALKGDFQTTLVEKYSDQTNNVSLDCFQVNLDWSFSKYSASHSIAYLQQMRTIQKCLNPNQTFKSLMTLTEHAIQSGRLDAILDLQGNLIQSAFLMDESLSFRTAKDLFSASNSEISTITKTIESYSRIFAPLKDQVLGSEGLRKLLASLVASPNLYRSAEEFMTQAPARTRSEAPRLNLATLSRINAKISRERTLKNVDVSSAVSALVLEYCPSLNPSLKECQIDADQVQAYRQSPATLYAQVAKEYLNSSQSWIHPFFRAGWSHTTQTPTRASQFEYHLNPLLHEFHGSKSAPDSLMKALGRLKTDHISISNFIQDRAVRLTLIPYRFEVPKFPEDASHQFHSKIRIRIVSDLDRLELIAINAEFKPFNWVKNFGMGMMKDIALAWGDVPERDRPASLNQFVNSSEVKTLLEVKESIETLLNRIDSSAWSYVDFNSEVSDLRARVFNLRFLVSLLEDEVLQKDGGHGGLALMRDLFYSLYEANTNAQRGMTGNGLHISENCLKNPLQFQVTPAECQLDLLSLIPRITHLGLLHQAGLASLKADDNIIPAVGRILDHITQDPGLQNKLASLLGSNEGIRFTLKTKEFILQAPENTSEQLKPLLELLSIIPSSNWIHLGLELMERDPDFLLREKSWLNILVSSIPNSLQGRVDRYLQNSKLPTPQVLQGFISGLGGSERSEAIQILESMSQNSGELTVALETLSKTKDLENVKLMNDLRAWLQNLSKIQSVNQRTALSAWVRGSGFDHFCAVFSDTQLIHDSMMVLDSIHQNPDSLHFLEQCENFLKSH